MEVLVSLFYCDKNTYHKTRPSFSVQGSGVISVYITRHLISGTFFPQKTETPLREQVFLPDLGPECQTC